MKKLLLLTIIPFIVSGMGFAPPKEDTAVTKGNLSITSPAFNDNGTIPVRYTVDGEGLIPPLSFTGAPKDAKSLALVLEDPDAPRGTFVHWVIYNIAPDAAGIGEGSSPAGASFGRNSIGKAEYICPSPPPGKLHHYIFTLYALDAELDRGGNYDRNGLSKAMDGHILDQARLTGTYGR
ncbi:MAG TPA: YbhB/YbcL family Raf kinase inhibitor-like protein [Candidatus Omnitrophota bacterium]|nr:YbhB/YbcL family Raf kinase inhibitor-like protein [Candidatus Omnitrophota bacterium]